MSHDYERRYREEIDSLQRQIENLKIKRTRQAKDYNKQMDEMQGDWEVEID